MLNYGAGAGRGLGPSGSSLFVVDADGNNLKPVGNVQGMFPSWTAGSNALVCTRMNQESGLFIVGLDGVIKRQLLGGKAFMGTLSPNGRMLAYVIVEGPGAGLYVTQFNGTPPRRLAGGPNEITVGPRWSRDNNRLFFTWMARNERIDAADDGDIGPAEFGPDPDLERNDPAPKAVHVIDIDGRNLRRVTESDSMEYAGGGAWMYSAGSWNDLAARRMPTTSWRTGPKPPPTPPPPISADEKAAAEWIQQIGGEFHRDKTKPGHPINSVLLSPYYANENSSPGEPISDDDLKRLIGLKHLALLYIKSNEITDAGLRQVAQFKGLRELMLNATEVTDEGLKHLAGCESLETLGLMSTQVTDEGLKHLAPLGSLRRLDYPQTQITDSTLRTLREIGKLNLLGTRSFNFSGTKVTDAGLKELRQRKRIEQLNLKNTPITDVGLAELLRYPNLQWLNLESTKVTDAGLNRLVGLRKLRTLYLDGTEVTYASVRKLKNPSKAASSTPTDSVLKHVLL